MSQSCRFTLGFLIALAGSPWEPSGRADLPVGRTGSFTGAEKAKKEPPALYAAAAANPPPAAATASVESPRKVLPANVGLDQGGKFGHWGNEGENDWVDDRWNKMESGPFLSSSLQTPAGLALKAIAIRVGDHGEGAVCFDAGQLNLKAGWIGGFLQKSPKRFGIIEMPRIDGEIVFESADGPGWADATTRYRGLYLRGSRVVLSYEVGNISVLDLPWIESRADLNIFTRTLELGSTPATHRLTLVNAKTNQITLASGASWTQALWHQGTKVTVVRLSGANVELVRLDKGLLAAHFPAQPQTQRVKVFIWSGDEARLADFQAYADLASRPEDLSAWAKPGPRRWSETITTRGNVGRGPGPFIIDTLALPYENPRRALLFVSGHDFFSNGDAAICTLHGDVWRVSGIDDRLESLRWTRLAAGLFQPLGLRIVNDLVHVIGRDQITRLQDFNGDGEADFYENFHNAIRTSDGGHDFVACLESDRAGNFYYVDPLGLHRVSPNGASQETLAAGWRNPNGLSVSPDGAITVSPQEGEWTPASLISEVKPGGWYGYGGPKVTTDRPLGYDPPLCWIPRYLDNSSGGEVWVPRDRWGALSGQLLHLSYGRCQAMLVLRDVADGPPQGAIVPLKGRFLSGIMRGRFRQLDGHLYVSGLKGWVTSALRDGCLQRVRYTGEKFSLPVAFRVQRNGLRLTFSEPLDRAWANDPENYGLEQWNYRYAAEYGSKEYSVLRPDVEGHDPVELRRATLLEDGRTVFLEIADLRPVMQFQVQYNLADKAGATVRGKLIATINRLGPTFEPAAR